MSDAILAAGLAGTVITVLATLMEYRLKALEEKQDKHNQVIKRA